MKALVYRRPRKVSVELAKIQGPTDAVVEITSTNTCGSDLRIHEGRQSGAGQASVKRHNRRLRELVHPGKARPSFIVSYDLPLEKGPDTYENLDKREGGWTEVVFHPDH